MSSFETALKAGASWRRRTLQLLSDAIHSAVAVNQLSISLRAPMISRQGVAAMQRWGWTNSEGRRFK